MNNFKVVAAIMMCVTFMGCSEQHRQVRHPRPNPPQPHVVYPPQQVLEPVIVPHELTQPLVYCRRCGVIPGKASNCPNYSSHDFASVPAGWIVVCRRCGVIATNEPTRCPNYSSHDFMPVKPGTTLVCTRCGAAPSGEPTQCPNYSSHAFKVFK